MVLNRYIALSLLSHLLLFGIIGMTHTISDLDTSVFNVDIVSPLEKYVPLPDKDIKPALKKRIPVMVKKRRRPPEKSLFDKDRPEISNEFSPETLFGDGSNLDSKADGNSGTAEKSDNLKEVVPEQSSSAEKERELLPTNKNGMTIVPGPLLFDRKTIEKYARRGIPAKKGLSFDAPDFKHRGYLRMLHDRIESIWVYPREAAMRGISGDLYILITINRDGTLADLELMRTSGFVDLDQAAIKALKKAFPWASLPKDFEGDQLKIMAQFIYVYGPTYSM